MKTLNIPLEDRDFELILKRKGSKTWREFLLEGSDKDKTNDKRRL